MNKNLSIALVLFGLAGLTACKKESDNSTKSTVQLRMTDGPGDWQQVNLDIREVKIKFVEDSSDTDGWESLQTNGGIYDVLRLQNGLDTLLATGSFPIDRAVREIRLILGPNNSIKVLGVVYPLTIPSGAESGLKIKLNKKLLPLVTPVLIDFDAALSIKEENGGYKLKPVIKLK
ncbi:MAG: DUF4382 domain-containing protein [Chitinophagaceae bacterium]